MKSITTVADVYVELIVVTPSSFSTLLTQGFVQVRAVYDAMKRDVRMKYFF